MKIALVSYEYPPDTAFGGIATYVQQAALMLCRRGHHVEVFTSSPMRSETAEVDGITVHRIQESSREVFPQRIGAVFHNRHRHVQFDVLEGPEYGADARECVRVVPDIPLVIKLHTPSVLIYRIGEQGIRVTMSARQRFRRSLRPLRRGRDALYDPARDDERRHALCADEIAAPSRAIADKVKALWRLQDQHISCFPIPYIPSDDLLSIPLDTRHNRVSFTGRIEARKGALDLAKAVPLVLAKHPNTRFRFVGKPEPEYLSAVQVALGIHQASVEFTGAVPLDQLPAVLAETDLCVYPSLWESFGIVCLEAMAAGRGVIGSSSGGMAELLDGGKVGRLIPPRSPKRIAAAVIELLDNPKLRMQLGQAARQRVLDVYNQDVVGALQEASYERAIEHRKRAKHRTFID